MVMPKMIIAVGASGAAGVRRQWKSAYASCIRKILSLNSASALANRHSWKEWKNNPSESHVLLLPAPCIILNYLYLGTGMTLGPDLCSSHPHDLQEEEHVPSSIAYKLYQTPMSLPFTVGYTSVIDF